MARRPTTPGQTISFSAPSVPVSYSVDVLVVGAGSAGLAAAVAAARQGAKSLLAERYGFLGGTGVGAPVTIFQEGPKVKGRPVIQGIYAEIKERLARCGGLEGRTGGIDFSQQQATGSETFEPAMMQLVCLDMCDEAGVQLMLHSYLAEVITQDGGLRYALFANKDGLVAVEAKQFVDTTADGDLSAAAGARVEIGRPSDGLTQPATLPFQLGNIDFQKLESADWKALYQLYEKEAPEGRVPRGRFMFTRVERENRLVFSAMTHVAGTNAANNADRTYMEVAGRRQAEAVMEFFRRHVPGCEHCRLVFLGCETGIRESRRVMGDYVITRQDVLEARKFPDSVGASTSWIDIHDPDAHSILHEFLPYDDWFEIPYRALTTSGISNLYAAGRCVSCTHEALGSMRMIPMGMMTGEAAGVAAGLCALAGIPSRQLDINKLQRILVAAGAFIGSAQPQEAAPQPTP